MSNKRKSESKKLQLHRETVRHLVSLDDSQLGGVVGGALGLPTTTILTQGARPPRTGNCTTMGE